MSVASLEIQVKTSELRGEREVRSSALNRALQVCPVPGHRLALAVPTEPCVPSWDCHPSGLGTSAARRTCSEPAMGQSQADTSS